MSFRHQLHHELSQRRSHNPRYSLRAFARLLEMSPGHLSEVLRGSRNLSPRMAVGIAQRLGYNGKQTLEFVSRVQAGGASMTRTLALLDEQNAHGAVSDALTLDLETIKAISEWYHYAILELTYCRGFRGTPKWVARKLGISVAAAAEALRLLQRLGILRKSRGTLIKTSDFVTSPSNVPSRAIKRFHSQMIQKAKGAIRSHAVDTRDMSSLTMAIDPAQISEAKIEIQKFRRRMAQLLSKGRPSNVYQLNVQFFSLQTEKAKE
jgi:uncharacterized protein (TIGR02147 family)